MDRIAAPIISKGSAMALQPPFTNSTPSVQVVDIGAGVTAWRLEEDYYYHWQHGDRWYRFMIPSGFVFDGASVPWFLRWVAGRGRFGVTAPLVHDWLHHKTGFVIVQVWVTKYWVCLAGPQEFTRREADALFFRELRQSGVKPRWLRRGAFKAVRIWSWFKGDQWR